MTKRVKTLQQPKHNEVKIWFQGSTGSGKTLLSNLIKRMLKERGVKVRPYISGSGEWVGPDNQWVDLTRQGIEDVLTIELDSWKELKKLLDLGEAAE
jgi:hypothetical protein